MPRKVKLADVARDAGVSQGTASNAFNRPELVRPEVRERVEEAARRLGYAGPDPKGRLLRAGKVNAIGVVVNFDLKYFFSDPFSRMLMTGVAEVCDARAAGIALVSSINDAVAAWGIGSAVVDGFVLQCIEDGDRLVELAKKRGLPFVALDHDPGPDASLILIDELGGGRIAAEHLVGLGHRKFGILGLEFSGEGHTGLVDMARREAAEYDSTRDRLIGYSQVLAAAGIDVASVPVIEAQNDAAGAAKGAAELFDAAPDMTAILAMSDVVAIAAIQEAAKRGKSVPGDISIVGFDDVPEAAASIPPLTTIRQPIVEKGRLAAELILDGGPVRREKLPVNLVLRQSTAPPRHA
jgi:DNA-binding LacI/PurR family transcriptional regulator